MWFRSTVIMVFAALLNGCISLGVSEKVATRDEPQETKMIFLTADDESYTISRWWGNDFDTLSIKRRDLPSGCETARFFLNDSHHELKLMEPVKTLWITEVQPPLADESYPSCALLVSYGVFSGPPEMEGMVVTSSAGLIAKSKRQKPQPAVWALTPAAMMAEGYAMVGAVWTLPVWGPILYFKGKNEEARRERYLSEFPTQVTACWTAIDDKVKVGWLYGTNIKVAFFNWPPESQEYIYTLTKFDESFSNEDLTPIDTQVILHKGQLVFTSQKAGVDIECGLRSGDVVAIRVEPLL